MAQRSLPGPVGTSCLTCKRRRKKCDQGRPTCQKCTQGGLECLGYNHIRQRKNVGPDVGASQYESMDGVFWVAIHAGSHSDPRTSDHVGRIPFTFGTSVNIDPQALAVLPHGPRSNDCAPDEHASTTALPDLPCNTTPGLSLAVVNSQQGVGPLSSSSILASTSGEFNGNRSNWPPISDHGRGLFPTVRAARALSTLSPGMQRVIRYVLDQYERVLDSVFFKPEPLQVDRMRTLVTTRLQASSITRCSVLLVAKILEAQLNGNAYNNRVTFQQLVERFENQLREAKTRRLNPLEFEYLLNGLLEVTFLKVAFLKMRVSSEFHIYQLLHDAAPTFFEIVNFDPNLWPDPNGPPIPCISKVITSTRFELAHFALVDILCSMAYGLPQVVDYDTTTLVPETEIHPIAWVHCCPLEFQVSIAEMNQRCAKSYVAPDWHVIEYRLLSYQAPTIATDSAESWKTIARLAVLESWRQVLLIYLYMAVCGVPSDDTRVQSAVRQTFQLFSVGEREGSPNIHFMFQYLIAGACTPNEKQRTFARKRLSNASNHERWLLPGCEFVPVLDHLWHGAAADGQPFRWSDYIKSRQVALPVPM
ncbi:unnamed protein product [Rhizoctonia solani]|uniref:Zn(2)-C6 fungal-type domain-containing protein n=1 Tax=Rhizoctonia solani TaxID=456999 RepID=A0A8H3CLF9_9AGAM|nr:unnamed protein product [Rhizoctonia solani]